MFIPIDVRKILQTVIALGLPIDKQKILTCAINL